MFNCYICSEDFPDTVKEDHHIVPRSIRNTTETVRICSNCHSNTHAIANCILKGKPDEVEIALNGMYKSPRALFRCSNLAKVIVHESLEHEDEPQEKERELVTIKLSSEEKSLLKLAASDKNKSITKYIRDLIIPEISGYNPEPVDSFGIDDEEDIEDSTKPRAKTPKLIEGVLL